MVTLRIALRYLLSRKSHNAVNVISQISVAGVAVATAVIVCVLSVFNGFSELTASRLSHIDAQLRIVPSAGKVIARADSIAVLLSADSALISSAQPVVEERALAIYRGRQVPVNIKGVADDYSRIAPVGDVVIDGEFQLSDGDFGCATLSVGSAIALGAHPGFYDLLQVFTPRRTGRINPAAPARAFRADSLIVAAVYEVEQSEYDSDRIIVPISTARRLLDYTTEATAIELALQPSVDEKDATVHITTSLGDGYRVLNRFQQQEQSFRMIAIEKWITFAMLAFILAIASFNVVSTMSMLIIEKQSNIATLSALGASPGMVSRIFMLEGWLISLLGGIAGIALGVALCLAQEWGGFIRLNGDPSQLSVTAYPVQLQWADLVIVFLLVALIGAAIGAVASRFSARLSRRHPAEA